MKIHTFTLGQIDTNAYLVFPASGNGAILVDAPLDAASVVPDFLEKSSRKLSAILLTHAHWDHVWDAADLSALSGAKIYAGENGRKLLEDADFQRTHMFSGAGLKPAKIGALVRDGETLDFDGLKVKCLETPGHCPGSFAYFMEDESGAQKALFSGDLIFAESVGRTDFWGGDFSALEKSVKEKVYTLPPETVVYPGHGESTSVARERAGNPFVRP